MNVELQSTSARVLAELIRTPAMREIVKLNVQNLKPEAAVELVRTLLWQDPALSLGLIAAAPQAINCVIAALLELAVQLRTIPPELLEQFLDQLASKIDTERLAALPVALAGLLDQKAFDNPELRQRVLAGLASGINSSSRCLNALLQAAVDAPQSARATAALDPTELGRTLSLTARLFNQRARSDPQFVPGLFAALDGRELLVAAWRLLKGLARSLWDRVFKRKRRV